MAHVNGISAMQLLLLHRVVTLRCSIPLFAAMIPDLWQLRTRVQQAMYIHDKSQLGIRRTVLRCDV